MSDFIAPAPGPTVKRAVNSPASYGTGYNHERNADPVPI